MAILPIRIYPDPILRACCREVETFDDELRALAADMVETMHAAPGIGLAAPQVGRELRLAAVDLSVGKDPEQLHILVNPRILEADKANIETEVEGCLSLPEYTEKVDRPGSLRLEAQNLHGEPFEMEVEGLLARAIYHEVDHLEGVLFVDRLRGLRRERARRWLRRMAQEAAEKVRTEVLA